MRFRSIYTFWGIGGACFQSDFTAGGRGYMRTVAKCIAKNNDIHVKTNRIIIISVLFYGIKWTPSLSRVNIIRVCPSKDSRITRYTGLVPLPLSSPNTVVFGGRPTCTRVQGFRTLHGHVVLCAVHLHNQTVRKRRTNTREGEGGEPFEVL